MDRPAYALSALQQRAVQKTPPRVPEVNNRGVMSRAYARLLLYDMEHLFVAYAMANC